MIKGCFSLPSRPEKQKYVERLKKKQKTAKDEKHAKKKRSRVKTSLRKGGGTKGIHREKSERHKKEDETN